MSISPRAVLFDWEGTLVDFQWNLTGAVAEAHQELVRLGFPRESLANNYASLRNEAVRAAPTRGINPHCVGAVIDRVYDRYDSDALSRWSLKPPVQATLRFLAEQKIPAGLVTNIGRTAVEQALTQFTLDGAFRITVTRNDISMLKPDGEGIRTAINKLGISTQDVLFIGDSLADIGAAHNAQVAVAILSGGESSMESVVSAQPTFVWDSLNELRTLFTGGE